MDRKDIGGICKGFTLKVDFNFMLGAIHLSMVPFLVQISIHSSSAAAASKTDNINQSTKLIELLNLRGFSSSASLEKGLRLSEAGFLMADWAAACDMLTAAPLAAALGLVWITSAEQKAKG